MTAHYQLYLFRKNLERNTTQPIRKMCLLESNQFGSKSKVTDRSFF